MIATALLRPVASNVPCSNPKGHDDPAGTYSVTCYRYLTKSTEPVIPKLHWKEYTASKGWSANPHLSNC
jgi:hypothetical protein